MISFSTTTQALLTEAGWHPARSIPTLGHRQLLLAEGYSWFSAVESFLAEFGELSVAFSRLGSTDRIHFDARKASEDVDAAWILQEYAKRIGTSTVCVIGQAYTDHLLLFMDGTGNVYGGYDDYLCFIASSGPAALEVILQNQPLQEIANPFEERY